MRYLSGKVLVKFVREKERGEQTDANSDGIFNEEEHERDLISRYHAGRPENSLILKLLPLVPRKDLTSK